MKMNLPHAAFAACLAIATSGAFAAGAMDSMRKDDTMTAEQCRAHMAMSKKDDMKKDEATMKKEAACADVLKKEEMSKKNGDAMKK